MNKKLSLLILLIGILTLFSSCNTEKKVISENSLNSENINQEKTNKHNMNEYNLSEYIKNGPFDKTRSCLNESVCYKTFKTEKMENQKDYLMANDIFAKEAPILQDKFLNLLKESSDLELDSEMTELIFYFEAELENSINKISNNDIDKIAQNVLTKESYEVEKVLDFFNFKIFIKDFLTIYSAYFESSINEYLDKRQKTPLEGEKEFLMESLKVEIKDSIAKVKFPDSNSPKISGYYRVEFGEKGEVYVLEPELEFPMFIIINDKRVSYFNPHYSNFSSFLLFDLVKINNTWKIDILEPNRPNKNKNPRIVYFGLDEKELNNNWQEIEEKVFSINNN